MEDLKTDLECGLSSVGSLTVNRRTNLTNLISYIIFTLIASVYYSLLY